MPDVSGLVTEDDTPVDNLYAEKQQRLLTAPLYAGWDGPQGDDGAPGTFVAMANVGLFATVKEPPLVPDALVSVDVTFPDDIWVKEHRSYFVWEYGKVPDVVIEVVSNREGGELSEKLRRYARMRIPFYVVWDPELILGGAELHPFQLQGKVYAPVERAWIPQLELELLPWEGAFERCTQRWLRWHDAEGRVIKTGEERAEAESARAEAESARAEAESARAEAESARAEAESARAEVASARAEAESARAEAESARAEAESARASRLAERLRALGIDPDAP